MLSYAGSRIALNLGFALLSLACSAADSRRSPPGEGEVGRIDPELTVRRIAPDTYIVTHEPAFSSNVLVARMADGSVLLCSSPLDTQATRTMLQWLREVFDPYPIVAINPHYHPDGTAGNEAYVEAGVEIYASELTQRWLSDHGERVRDEAAAALRDPGLAARVRGTRIVPATHTIKVDEPFTLILGGEQVHVIHPGPAHSPDNVVVYLSARGILFGGCMIKAGRSIGNTADANLANWESAVHAVEGLGVRIVVPGHGPAGGPELLQNTIDVVRAACPSCSG